MNANRNRNADRIFDSPKYIKINSFNLFGIQHLPTIFLFWIVTIFGHRPNDPV